MKKVGLLMSSEIKVSAYLYELYEFLKSYEKIDLYVLVADPSVIRPPKKIYDRINAVAFSALLKFEGKLFRDKLTNNLFCSNNIDYQGCKVITVHPVFSSSGLYVSYEKVDELKELDLDLIIRGNAPGIFRGDILDVSELGLLSFHHGDNRWNRGSAPCFWEVFHKKSGTGFILQLLNTTLDGGKVVRRGTYQTKGTYVTNLSSVYSQSNEEIIKFLRSWVEKDTIAVEGSFPFDRKVVKSPSLKDLLIYVLKVYGGLFKRALSNRKLLYKPDWSVGFSYGMWRQASLSKIIKLRKRNGTFIADPFPYQHSTGDYIFVEEFEYSQNKGSISIYEVSRTGDSEYLGKIIQEKFHLSFPFIFEFNNELYMVPESSANRDVRLYKCISFPMKWEFVHTLFEDVNFADTMIIEVNGVWALLTNRASCTGEHNSNLSVYTAESPLSKNWKLINDNVYLDSHIARNGGILTEAGKLFRVSQSQGFNNYGEKFLINEILELNEDNYREINRHVVNPTFLKNQTCTHHFSNWKDLYVVDFKS